MKSPLRKRIPRELKGEIGKYLVVFILMVATIGMVSGFLVADGSMIQAYDEGFEKYNIEDGNFRTGERLYRGQREAIEEEGVKIYENYYIEDSLSNGSTMRFFKNRTEVDKVCLMDGELPSETGEIAIDRMYADNNSLKTGDTLDDGTKSWTITGLVALSDYSCLFQSNNDSMFDAVKFGVGVVTDEEFDSLDQDKLQYNYAWTYNEKPQTELEEKNVSEDLMKAMGKVVTLENFVPQYQNQAIIFTGDDMGSDKAMMIMLLYIIIVIMAFVFGITTSNTIAKEAGVIGTLRASGYTKNELIRHYMTLPVIVTLVGALIGNILGYTAFKDVCAGMYYGSYVAHFLAGELLDFFAGILQCFRDGDEMEHAEPLPQFSDLLREEYLWSEEYDGEADEMRYEEDEVFPADEFYSFYYDSWQSVEAYRDILEQVPAEFAKPAAAVLELL